jgi:hypothetical protein
LIDKIGREACSRLTVDGFHGHEEGIMRRNHEKKGFDNGAFTGQRRNPSQIELDRRDSETQTMKCMVGLMELMQEGTKLEDWFSRQSKGP